MTNDETKALENIRALHEHLLRFTCRLILLDEQRHPTNTPASGFLVNQSNKLVLLSAGHVLKLGNWFLETDVYLKKSRETVLIPITDINTLASFTIDFTKIKDIDFAFAILPIDKLKKEAKKCLKLKDQKIDFISYAGPLNNTPILNTEFYSYSSWNKVKDDSTFEREATYEFGMLYIGNTEDDMLYKFSLARKHQGHTYYNGASGSPIVDPEGKIVSMVIGGDYKNDIIYGLQLKNYISGIDAAIATEVINSEKKQVSLDKMIEEEEENILHYHMVQMKPERGKTLEKVIKNNSVKKPRDHSELGKLFIFFLCTDEDKEFKEFIKSRWYELDTLSGNVCDIYTLTGKNDIVQITNGTIDKLKNAKIEIYKLKQLIDKYLFQEELIEQLTDLAFNGQDINKILNYVEKENIEIIKADIAKMISFDIRNELFENYNDYSLPGIAVFPYPFKESFYIDANKIDVIKKMEMFTEEDIFLLDKLTQKKKKFSKEMLTAVLLPGFTNDKINKILSITCIKEDTYYEPCHGKKEDELYEDIQNIIKLIRKIKDEHKDKDSSYIFNIFKDTRNGKPVNKYLENLLHSDIKISLNCSSICKLIGLVINIEIKPKDEKKKTKT
jgi:hypothetical protein